MLKKLVSSISLLILILAPALSVHPQPAPSSVLPVSVVSRLEAPGRLHVRALAASYPDRIAETAFRDGEWAVRIDDTWFYWADGRMLPEAERFNSENYTGVRFYNYSLGPPVQRQIDAETAERLRNRDRQPTQAPRHNGFLDALYGITTRVDAYTQIVPVTFLGMSTQVHRMMTVPLANVEREIRALMISDAEIRVFVAELHQVSAFIWRDIAGTNRRSYHSYGVAIDLIPRSYRNRFGYWRWAMESGVEDWWEVPLEQRWQVPQPVIDSFERHGFIWGGKWLSFDPIHFEYRPEVIQLSRWRDAGVR